MEKLGEIFSQFIRPYFNDWTVRKTNDPDVTEKFDPITLLNSFVESEMDLEFSFTLFDKVIPVIDGKRKRGGITHNDIHRIVVQELLSLDSRNAMLYLSHYENLYGPDIEEINEENYVNVRSASQLKEYIANFLGLELSHDESNDIGLGEHNEIRDINNRFLKLIRFCGFYKVDKKFLDLFLNEITERSVKGFLPSTKFNGERTAHNLQEACRVLVLSKETVGKNYVISSNYLDLFLEEIGREFLTMIGSFPAIAKNNSFYQYVNILKTVKSVDSEKSILPRLTEVKTTLEQRSNLKGSFFDSHLALCISILESVNKQKDNRGFLRQAIDLSDRLLRSTTSLLNPNDYGENIASFSGEQGEKHTNYLTSCKKRIAPHLPKIEIFNEGEYLRVDISSSIHDLVNYGKYVNLRFLYGRSQSELDAYEFYDEKKELESGNIIPIIVTDGSIGGEFLDRLLDTSLNQKRPIIPLRRHKFEESINEGEDIRNIIIQSLYKWLPKISEWTKPIHSSVNIHIPSALDAHSKKFFEDQSLQILSGKGTNAAVMTSTFFESSIKEFVCFLYSAIAASKADSYLLTFWPDDGNLNSYIGWLSKIRMEILNSNHQLEKYLPTNKEITMLHDLRKMRNSIQHDGYDLETYEAKKFIENCAQSISILFRSRKGNQPFSYNIMENEKYLFSETTGFIQTNYKSIDDKLYSILGYSKNDKKGIFFPAYVTCQKCKTLSMLINIESKPTLTCQNCNHCSRLPRLWKHLIKQRSDAVEYRNQNGNGMKNTRDLDEMTEKHSIFIKGLLHIVAEATGPFGIPLKGLLASLDEEKTIAFEKKLFDSIERGQSIALEAYTLAQESTNENRRAIKLLEAGINTLIDYNATSPDFNILEISKGQPIAWPMFSITSIPEHQFAQELERLYSTDIDLLRTDLQQAAIKITRIQWSGSMASVAQNVVIYMRGISQEHKYQTLQKLKECNPSSSVISTVLEQFETISDNIRSHKLGY